MRVFGVLGRALVRWPDARAELRQARVARRFNMMLFGCHASFGQLGQRRGQLEFICDDAAKLPYAATLAPLSIAYIVAKGALEALNIRQVVLLGNKNIVHDDLPGDRGP